MTDEKLADEYLKNLDECKTKDMMRDTYLAGLKAGKDMNVATKWHKVADGDLPKEEAEYLVIFESDGTKYIGLECYYPDTKEWSTVCKIVAWLGIPKFEEVEGA